MSSAASPEPESTSSREEGGEDWCKEDITTMYLFSDVHECTCMYVCMTVQAVHGCVSCLCACVCTCIMYVVLNKRQIKRALLSIAMEDTIPISFPLTMAGVEVHISTQQDQQLCQR